MGEKRRAASLKASPDGMPSSKMIKATVTKVLEPQQHETCPFLCYFPSGFVVDDNKLLEKQGITARSIEFEAHVSSTPGRLKKHILIGETPKVDFIGKPAARDIQTWHPGRLAIGVFDRDSGNLQIVPVTGNRLFRMEPRVRGVNYEEDALSKEEEKEVLEEKEQLEKFYRDKSMLTQTFGSKKTIAVQLARQRGAITAETIGNPSGVQDYIKSVVKAEGTLTMKEIEKRAARLHARNIPPHDLDATTQDGAYPIDLIIPHDHQRIIGYGSLLRALSNPNAVTAIMEGKFYCNFVKRRLHTLQSDDHAMNEKRAGIFVYLNLLRIFRSLPHSLVLKKREQVLDGAEEKSVQLISDIPSIAAMVKIPAPILEHFISLFSEQVDAGPPGGLRYIRPQKKDELLLGYMLVLSLTADNYVSDPVDLAGDLKMTIPQLIPHYKELGCSVAKKVKSEDKSVMYRVSLPVPLKFPTVRMKGKRK